MGDIRSLEDCDGMDTSIAKVAYALMSKAKPAGDESLQGIKMSS